MNESIQYVIRAATAGQSEYRDWLLAQIHEIHTRRINCTRRRLQTVQPRVGASDVGQDFELAVWQGLASFDGQTQKDFESWMRGILENTLNSEHRKQHAACRNVGRTRPVEDGSTPLEFPAPCDTPSQAAQSNETSDGLRAAMDVLRARGDIKLVVVLELYYLQELSFSQIADVLSITECAAKKRASRAREELRKIMGLNQEGTGNAK